MNIFCRLDLSNKNGSEVVTMIQKAAESHVKALIPVVCESDREISEMEEQLQELRLKLISRVVTPKKFAGDNQRAIEANNRDSLLRLEGGDSSIKMEITEEKSPPRTFNVHGDHCMGKESQHPKVDSWIPNCVAV